MRSTVGRTLDVGTLKEHAKKMSRDEFVREHPGYYLVVTPHPEMLSIGYRTMNLGSIRERKAGEEDRFEVVPIVKARHSPYRDRVSIGRAINCDIVLRDAAVSKLHAHFHGFESDTLSLVDLGSSNGTLVNDAPIEAQHPVILEPGDTLQVGGAKARVADGEALYDFLR